MSILDHIKKTVAKSPRITIYGKAGVGKSTLAASFPDPLLIQIEETGIEGIDALPICTSFDQVYSAINHLLKVDDFKYKTIIIDTISKLDALVVEKIVGEEKKPNASLASAGGGYGAGYLMAQSLHRSLKSKLDKFQDKGVTVIYVAHSATTKFKAPDSDDYDIYSIVMNNDKSREVYIDDVDLVAFCRLKKFVVDGKVVGGSERVMTVGASDGHVSKNRYGMPDEISMSFDEIKKYIQLGDKKDV